MLVRIFLVFLMGLSFFHHCLGETFDAVTVAKMPVPSWVSQEALVIPERVPVDEVEDGIYYLLLEDQIKVDEQAQVEKYTRRSQLIINESGLESSAQITLDFDPTYQSIGFNSLTIFRNEETIDKLEHIKISVLQREAQLESLIYDGRLTASIILDDVRVGDAIEYSYTITGSNPVYDGNFSYSMYLQWAVPVYEQKLRVLWGKPTALNVFSINTNHQPTISTLGEYQEYVSKLSNEKPYRFNSELPQWYDPRARIFFSEFGSWQQVVGWALTLYKNVFLSNDQVLEVVNQIKKDHSNTPDQIAAALQFVQREIRYLGIEMGTNSHKPSSSIETLERRYGDCKDKVVLFNSSDS